MVPYVQCEKFQRSFCPPAVDTPTLPNITCQLDTQIGSTEQHEENSILGRFQLFCIRSFQFELNLIVPGAPASCRRSANSPQQQQQTIFIPPTCPIAHLPPSSSKSCIALWTKTTPYPNPMDIGYHQAFTPNPLCTTAIGSSQPYSSTPPPGYPNAEPCQCLHIAGPSDRSGPEQGKKANMQSQASAQPPLPTHPKTRSSRK